MPVALAENTLLKDVITEMSICKYLYWNIHDKTLDNK